jgi:hypothetical protein
MAKKKTTHATPERIALTRTFLAQYHTLDRKVTSPEGWIALKFSCTVKQAKALIAAATPAPDPVQTRINALYEATYPAPPPERVVCPDCGEDIQAEVTFDCDVDATTGVIERALSGGQMRLYCSVDCGWEWEMGDLVGEGWDWPDPIKASDLRDSEIGRNEP